MSEKEPTNADILTALQGMWGQQKDLILGVEKRLDRKLDTLDRKIDTVSGDMRTDIKSVDAKIDDVEKRLAERITREIHDRPVVVHVDMGRVGDLEKRVDVLTARLAELEARLPT
jgi:hypothetical protein